VLERVLFKGKVRFLAVNVEACRPDPAAAAALVAAAEGRAATDGCSVASGFGADAEARGTSSRLRHAWMAEDGVRALRLAFVPNRMILHRGRVVRWWDGSGGNVVDGRHGASRANRSNELADEIARCLKLDAEGGGEGGKQASTTKVAADAARSRSVAAAAEDTGKEAVAGGGKKAAAAARARPRGYRAEATAAALALAAKAVAPPPEQATS